MELIVILFIAFVIFVAVGTWRSSSKQAQSNSISKNANRYSNSFPTKVVGVTFNNSDGKPIQSILPTLRAGMSLRFIREPYNQHDSNAIAVSCNGMGIGHLDKKLALMLAPMMDKNEAIVSGVISEITGGRNLTYGCNIVISLSKPNSTL